MDPLQLLQMLGAPVPAAPRVPQVAPGIGPGGTSPPVVNPGFLPGNLSNLMTLGQRPVPAGPAPIAAPRQLDVQGLMAKFAPGFEVPSIPEMQMTKTDPRAMPKFADPTKMLSSMAELRPQNNMVDEETFGQERFADAMSSAALAAAGASDIGSLLASAGGAFGKTAGAATKDRRAEELMFAERNREFDAQMANLQWDVDQATAEQENATSDVQFQNAQLRASEANAQLQLTLQQKEAERGAFLAKAGMELDLLQSNQQTALQAAQIEAQNQDRQAAYRAKYEPQWSISDDGTIMTQSYLDPATNKMVVLQEPIGVMGQLSQISQMAGTLPDGLGNEMVARAQYDNMARIAPQMFKRKLVMDILNTPKGEKVFDPDDAGTKGLFDTGSADNAEDYFNVGKTVADQFTTSPYEAIINRVNKFAQTQIEAGRWDAAMAAQQAQVMVAAELEKELDKPEVLKRAMKLSNPDLIYGLGLMK